MPLRASQLKVGDAREEVVIENLSRTQLVMYAGASGDYNPMHTDEVAAQAAGLPSVFGHGMFSMGLLGRALKLRDAQPQFLVFLGQPVDCARHRVDGDPGLDAIRRKTTLR